MHKAVVEVNEVGTEAAAACGFDDQLMSIKRRGVLKMDHPFLFSIVAMSLLAPIFVGRLSKPAQRTVVSRPEDFLKYAMEQLQKIADDLEKRNLVNSENDEK